MIRKLESSDGALLQSLLETDQSFFMKVYGHDAASEATNLFYSIPSGVQYERKCLIGVFDDGKLIGCLDGVFEHPSDNDAFVGFLFVSQNLRRCGFATSLINWFGIEAASRGARRILTSVSELNEPALDFFKSQNFTIDSVKTDVKLDLVFSNLYILQKNIV